MAGPIFPIFPSVAAIRFLRGAHRARFLVIIWLWATGLMSLPLATDGRALGLVDTAVGCIGCAAINSAAAPPYPNARNDGYTGGPLAYATPGSDVVAPTEDAITINDARPFEAPTQIRLHRFLQPYGVSHESSRPAQTKTTGTACSIAAQSDRYHAKPIRCVAAHFHLHPIATQSSACRCSPVGKQGSGRGSER